MKTFLLAIAAFLNPEKELSAKLVFDNIRNYLIAATFFALATWLERGAPATQSGWLLKPAFRNHLPYLTELALGAGTLLLLLCTAQSLDLVRRGILAFQDAMLRYFGTVEKHPSPLVGIFGSLLGLAVLLSSLFVIVLAYLYAATVIVALIDFSSTAGRAP